MPNNDVFATGQQPARVLSKERDSIIEEAKKQEDSDTTIISSSDEGATERQITLEYIMTFYRKIKGISLSAPK